MKNVRNIQKGFTLIELMIVIAILGILIAIALPAYQDYTIRTKNAECLNVAAAAKLAVSETFQSNNAWPASNSAAGYAFSASSYCASVAIGASGVITATVTNTGAAGAFTLTPDSPANSGRVDWTCSGNFTNTAHEPAECR
ncbi:pilin [Luteimonas sp. SDU82]|uniref:pilin n=1 Tax=Luteimonas sp. SDU82 TaxID=3422592 RepID=UPI003EB97D58